MSSAMCPKCNRWLMDLWEYGEGDHDIQCGWCEAPLVLRITISIDYELVDPHTVQPSVK